MNNIKNIPLSLICFIIASSILIAIPFVFEFGSINSNNNKETIYSYKLASPQKDTMILDLELLTIINIKNNTLTLKQYKPDISTDNQIYVSDWWALLYFALIVIHIIIIFNLEDSSIYIIGCRYLPTKSKIFYYSVNVESRIISVYRLSLVFLEKENTYKLDDNVNLTEKLIEISKELDKKYLSYEFEELKNWKK